MSERVQTLVGIPPKQLYRLGELAQKINDLSAGDRQYPRVKQINKYAVEMENIVKKFFHPTEETTMTPCTPGQVQTLPEPVCPKCGEPRPSCVCEVEDG